MPSDSDSCCDTKVLPRQPELGSALKHFRLESLLGEGGMGVVYRALDTRLCRPVAVKVLPAHLMADADRKQRFLQEAMAAARINHPAVAQIFSVDEDEGVTLIAMELVEGKTVRELVQGRELDLLGAIDIAIQVADGLSKAHELGIVHRDIKPANIMVTPDGHVKVLDFGLAKLMDPGVPTSSAGPAGPAAVPGPTTLPGVVMGTAAYMSPEQVRGVAVDGRADLFALGVLLFETITGRSPFQRENFMDSLHAVAFEEPPSLSSLRDHVPFEVQRIVSRCLKKNANDRYPDARSLSRDLRELRRQLEAGGPMAASWAVRAAEAWDRVRHLRPSQYAWFAAAMGAVGVAVYLALAHLQPQSAIWLLAVGLILYRRLRNGRRRIQDAFLRQVSRIPEVRLVVSREHEFTVVVDRPAAQLYSRINRELQGCNRRLFFGPSLTAAIVSDLPPEKTRELLSGPGVEYFRDDARQA